MNEMLVSIITVCYNSEGTIERTITSVLNQTYKSIEYIIVDGLSTDHTMDIVKKYEHQFNGRLKVISEKDDGIYDAMNKGIRFANGQLVGIINSDDFYEKTAVEDMVMAMVNENYQILYGLLRKTVKGIETQVVMTKHENLKNVMIPHPTCFITRRLYQDFGMYDTRYQSCADYEFMLRMSKNDNVNFIPVYKIIATFEEGRGMSAQKKSMIEVLRMKRDYGLLTRRQYREGWLKIIIKSFLSKGEEQ